MQELGTATYQDLLMQINQVLSSMEKDQLSVDELSQKLEESYILIEKLKSKLFAAEAQVEQIINSRFSDVKDSQT